MADHLIDDVIEIDEVKRPYACFGRPSRGNTRLVAHFQGSPPGMSPRRRSWGMIYGVDSQSFPQSGSGAMQNNVRAAREIAEARSAGYSSKLWATIPVTDGPAGSWVSFLDIVRAVVVGRGEALRVVRDDLGRFRPPDFDTVPVAILAAWFLDYGFFRFSLEQLPVAFLFGSEPVTVAEDMVGRLSVAGAQFLSGYQETDTEKRISVAPFAALTIKESMWGGPLPEEWIS
jgi:hypothetical protein